LKGNGFTGCGKIPKLSFRAKRRIWVKIHLLKLDVEGSEIDILRGADELLENGGIDFLQFEFGGCNIDSRTYFRDFYDLLSPRFRIFRIVTDGLRAVDEYREIGEIFTTTNYLCELRA
jgi:Methyltransferase FkbM domain